MNTAYKASNSLRRIEIKGHCFQRNRIIDDRREDLVKDIDKLVGGYREQAGRGDSPLGPLGGHLSSRARGVQS